MSSPEKDAARQERLAAKLRENLHRRKTQARGRADEESPPLPKEPPTG